MGDKGLTLSPIICNGVVLQRDVSNRIYGTETIEDRVTVSFLDKEYSTRVDENFNFCIELPPVAAGGPYSMTIKGSSEVVISDILFGDVYILSGQSNMELPILRTLDISGDEIKSAFEPTIRQYQISATYNFSEPEKYMPSGLWKKAVGEELMDFSAVGYFFAKEIKESYNVPIGLIMTAVGGSCIEAWMKPETLCRFGDYEKVIKKFKALKFFNTYIQEQQDSANEWALNIEKTEQQFSEIENYKEWNTCLVPSLVSDYNIGDFNGSVYLCKEVILENAPELEDAYIDMGGIIDSDKVWINGKLVGSTEYRYPPRKYPIQKGILKKGSNLITIRIMINNKNGGTIKGKSYHLFCDGKKINLAGEWHCRVGKKAEVAMPTVLFPPSLPICFYNTAVVPLSYIGVKGILWYQGESNTADPDDYAEKFFAMVSDWRELYDWEVPFLYVQLANYREPLNTSEDTGWATLREQQRKCLSIPNVAMVVTMDIGEYNDIHPQNKKQVGVRLAKAAGHLIYKETNPFSGPIPRSAGRVGNRVEILFDYLENTAQECSLTNFELAGSDGIFQIALAVRKGNHVAVSCNKLEFPTSVRYAWYDNPTEINFYNDAGLPASSFKLNI